MPVRMSYDDTDTQIRSIAETILNIDFKHAPLLKLFGFGKENLNKFDIKRWPSTTVEWVEDTNVIFSTLTTEALDSSETDIDVTTGHGQYFRKGDIIGILPGTQTYGEPVEKFLVSSVASDTLTVQARSYGDPAAATHSSGATVILISRADPENAIYTVEGMTTPTTPNNETQILSATVEMSRTEAKLIRYGMHQSHLDYQVAKLFDNSGSEGRLARMLHRTFYWGERVERTNTTTAPGSMGGFNVFVTTTTASSDHVVDLNGAPLERDDVHKVMRAILDNGGTPEYLVTSAWGIGKLCSLYEDNRYTTTDNKIGGSPQLETIRTPFGDVKLVYDYMCDRSEYYFPNASKIGWLPFDDFFRKTIYGDAMSNPYDGVIESVVGEYTMIVANPKTHGRIYDASVTA